MYSQLPSRYITYYRMFSSHYKIRRLREAFAKIFSDAGNIKFLVQRFNIISYFLPCESSPYKHYFMIIVEKANHGQVTMVSFMIFQAILYNINLIKYCTRVVLDTKFFGPKTHSFRVVACVLK